MRATCHRSSVQRCYCSGVFSLSHVVAIALWLVAAFLPLLLALGSRDFVLQVNSYRERPGVGLTGQVLSILEGEWEDGGETQPLTLVHSTFPERIQQLYPNESIRTSVVQTTSTDVNQDGIAESLNVEIATPLSINETIRQATVVVVLDYTIKRYAKLNMDALVVFRYSSPFAGDALYVDGDLDFQQRSVLEVTDSVQYPYADSPIVNMSTADVTQELLVQAIVSGYRARNYTAAFHAPNPVWNHLSQATTEFRVQLAIRIDPVNVLYTPQWPEILKQAWIQYYCLFMVVSTLTIALREYLFANKLLSSVCVVDEPRLKFATKYQ
ncbi:hypothetical protein PF005_g19964 [Phytophthora fragariae]|uniref:Transmembrane protein 231 n=1 Tax=Phytophthora fragariae TaxID=53985 RepID=A0A6A3J5E8_9STRA|nr:hypothetical protein PF003_g9584 [Phytophthora fragariae]KAE8929201.1 hypothetical protein PF009_g20680 [Phytophthora fragariae]KAE8989880.1 hypothetical protein PF011_g18583 [Phytophthora fragariae]KAE9088282.1 hypothetical protein PF007_g20036 [Phytophthora fragariae]KAE9088766.1 hypothetical protein PF010_g19263 [Phytophthora fragariae]